MPALVAVLMINSYCLSHLWTLKKS